MSVRPLPPVLAEKARVELNEDPKRLPEDLQHLKDWIVKQPHLRARSDDQWLVAFLRGCKFSLERTKEKLDMYYACREFIPEIFSLSHRDPKFMEIMDLQSFVVLPKPSAPDGPTIWVFRPGVYSTDKYSMTDIMSVNIILQKIILMEMDSIVVSGVRSVLDLEGASMAHFLQMTPMMMKKMITLSQDAIPIRQKGTHYLNTPSGFETIFNAFKGFLNEKNKSRLYVHNKDYEAMYKVIPKDCLPAEYGGSAGSFKEITDYWKNKVIEYSDWLDEDLKYGTDESRRPGKPRTAEDLFGLEGSFRKLEFD